MNENDDKTKFLDPEQNPFIKIPGTDDPESDGQPADPLAPLFVITDVSHVALEQNLNRGEGNMLEVDDQLKLIKYADGKWRCSDGRQLDQLTEDEMSRAISALKKIGGKG